jgi:beta-glucosidase/6-phospho-beta-glucosidase/beta-galactosidase
MGLPLLPSFVVAGFECSTPINRYGRRIDELALTQHDRHVRQDYRLLRELGIMTARDGARWNLIDQEGRLDFSSVMPFLDAAAAEGITVIWDLFHYGYPDDLDPFTPEFITRFADYCYAFARLVARRSHAIPFYTPVNEISYFAWVAGDQGDFAPHAHGRGPELKLQLARASIAGMNAILAVDSRARFVHCDPLCRVVAPTDAPHLAGEAEYFNYHCVHEAWDMIGGILYPELGGSARHLDIIGVNYYGYNQWEHQRPNNVIGPDDPRHMPFAEMLTQLYARYRRPLLVSETSSHADFRPSWLHAIGDECLRALKAGVDLHGLCLYPILDMFDWHDAGAPLGMGLWDLCRADDGDQLERVEHEATLRELQQFQHRIAGILKRSAPRPALAGSNK